MPFRLEVKESEDQIQTTLLRYPRARKSFEALRHVISYLERYFHGEKVHFTFELYLSSLTPFQRSVLSEVRRIPFGELRSYEFLATALGVAKGQRAVAQALALNPLPILIPCHRVVRKNGTLGGYSLGSHIKETLLRLEGIAVEEGFVHTASPVSLKIDAHVYET